MSEQEPGEPIETDTFEFSTHCPKQGNVKVQATARFRGKSVLPDGEISLVLTPLDGSVLQPLSAWRLKKIQYSARRIAKSRRLGRPTGLGPHPDPAVQKQLEEVWRETYPELRKPATPERIARNLLEAEKAIQAAIRLFSEKDYRLVQENAQAVCMAMDLVRSDLGKRCIPCQGTLVDENEETCKECGGTGWVP